MKTEKSEKFFYEVIALIKKKVVILKILPSLKIKLKR